MQLSTNILIGKTLQVASAIIIKSVPFENLGLTITKKEVL